MDALLQRVEPYLPLACLVRSFEKGHLPPQQCFLAFLSKVLGYAIIAGATILKLPQVSSILSVVQLPPVEKEQKQELGYLFRWTGLQCCYMERIDRDLAWGSCCSDQLLKNMHHERRKARHL